MAKHEHVKVPVVRVPALEPAQVQERALPQLVRRTPVALLKLVPMEQIVPEQVAPEPNAAVVPGEPQGQVFTQFLTHPNRLLLSKQIIIQN